MIAVILGMSTSSSLSDTKTFHVRGSPPHFICPPLLVSNELILSLLNLIFFSQGSHFEFNIIVIMVRSNILSLLAPILMKLYSAKFGLFYYH